MLFRSPVSTLLVACRHQSITEPISICHQSNYLEYTSTFNSYSFCYKPYQCILKSYYRDFSRGHRVYINSLDPFRCDSNLKSVNSEHMIGINSLAPGNFELNFRHVIFTDCSDWWLRHLLWNCFDMSLDFTDDQSTLVQVMAWCRQATSHYLNGLRWMPQNPFDERSTLVQVMAWCRQAAAIVWAIVDPDQRRHMASLVHNDLMVLATVVLYTILHAKLHFIIMHNCQTA